MSDHGIHVSSEKFRVAPSDFGACFMMGYKECGGNLKLDLINAFTVGRQGVLCESLTHKSLKEKALFVGLILLAPYLLAFALLQLSEWLAQFLLFAGGSLLSSSGG